MADGRCKPCSFYVPERDTELMRFMASQSNMSLSMRLLMKAFLASNRHATDIDVSLMDLGDLIRSMRVDPELFEDVPRRKRPYRSISAVEGDEIRAQEKAQTENRPPEPPSREVRSEPGFSQAVPPAPADVPDSVREPEPAPAYKPEPEPVSDYRPEPEPAPVYKPEPVPVPPAGPVSGSGSDPDDDLDPMSMMGEGY